MWISNESYYVQDEKLYSGSGSSMAYKFTFKDNKVIKYEIPKDGSYYTSSMKKIFPKSIYKKMINYDTTSLNNEIKNKVNKHYSYLNSLNINYKID